MSETPTKAELRERAKRNREALRPDSSKVCEGIARWLGSGQRPAGAVLVYSSMPGEIDLGSLTVSERFSHLGPFALTRTPPTGRTLSIHSFDTERETHPYGFSQPVAGAPVIGDSEIGVVLVPGLAFDRAGQRLGWGAGYYDRLLSRLGPDVVTVGVSDGFIVDVIPTEEHDVAMNFLATEAGVMRLPL